MKPKATRILTTLLLAFALAGCKGGGGSSGKKLKLAFVPNNSATFWVIARAGCEQAAKELPNVEVDFRMPSTGGAGEQQQIMDDLVAKGIDGIAVSPIDPANQTAFLDKIAGQTLLVCHDSDAPKSKRVCYIGTDNFASGVEAGKLLKEALPNGGKIMAFVGNADADNAQERYKGIKKELEGSKIEVIDLRSDDIDIVRAQKNAEDTLVKYPDIAGMVGLYAYNGPAILNAVRSANMVGKVKIVCFDEDDATLSGVAAGEIHGTVVQQPFEFGKQAITRMAKHLAGDKEALAGGRQIVPTRSLRKDDIAGFKAELSKITGK
ncbi:sugar-binding protein [Haloferula sp. BvORR071]|uniref:sugar-binding protein n=1 Tax=Haloferula sp. BvORR071 TaxID=1396141 RepID=UPI00054E2E9D|nr:sugar-binding protein [Haloferula sp. BvORR071]